MSKISELSNGGALLSTDDLIVVRSGGNVRAQLSAISGQSVSATTLAASGASTLTGAVGINITPTSYKLTVNSGATSETTAAAIGYNGDAGTSLYINTDHGNNLVSLYASGSSSKEMRFLSGTLEVMRLATTGNVGVGVGATTVNRKLEVAGNNNSGAKANYIRITDTDTTATANNQAGGIEFFTNDVTPGIAASMEVLYAGSGGGGEITFNTNASSSGTLTEALRIDESSNLLVGKTTTAFGTAGLRFAPTGAIDATVSGDGSLFLNRLGSDGPVQYFYKDSVSVGKIGTTGGKLYIGSQDGSDAFLRFESNEISPCAHEGSFRDNAISLGKSVSRFKNLYLSGFVRAGAGTAADPVLTGSDGNTGFFFPSGGVTAFTQNGVESMRIAASGAITMPAVYNDTTASAANMHISSAGGLLFRSTSSARYKNTITDATHGLTELLTLRPVTYKGNNDGDTVFGGLIAEEVHDAGLTEFVQYNEEDQPDALAYGNMVSLCIKAIQEQQATIEALTQRIQTLENN